MAFRTNDETAVHRLARYANTDGYGWASNGRALAPEGGLRDLLRLSRAHMRAELQAQRDGEDVSAARVVAPLEDDHEVWASGVTYLRSREARTAESHVADVYTRVYDAPRPELFFKAIGRRVVGPGGNVRIRRDSAWNVPEPELVLVINSAMEIVGYTAGNDMSSRDIEGDNPLYLPQAKMYEGSCAIGPEIVLAEPEELRDLTIGLEISRAARPVFSGTVRTSHMKRRFEELTEYLGRELRFPAGVFLMTGTGIVPPDDFTLQAGDVVRVRVGVLTMEHTVAT